MLQRAASNAYSWWWASHVRTKQTKWLEQSLQDMDERVQSMLKLIEEEGDSFAKRAEMYYKRRPELISSVEEAYKQYRALADRYDLLSKELQNANNTIASVFPEQVQFAMPEEEDGPNPRFPKNPQIPGVNEVKAPQAPKAPITELKNIISKASKQYRGNKLPKAQNANKVQPKSGLTKEEALDEVSKLQKDILALQTVKEFVKSSYESGIAKYWGIENQITEMQQRISSLQDEFNMDTVIEDDEARTLMAEAALKSCQETLAMLQEKQEKTTSEAREEYKRIEAACERLQTLRQKYLQEQIDDNQSRKVGDGSHNLSKDVADLIQETEEIEEKTEESVDLSSLASLSVTQLAEKIDQLVNRVISLETAVSSQTVLVNTLRSETDDLNAQIRTLEEENESLIDDTQNLGTRVKEMEEQLSKVQDLNKNVESRNSNLQTNFAAARTSLDHLSEKLSCVKADEEIDASANLDHPPQKPSSEKADEALEAGTNPDHPPEKLSSVKTDEELEARSNPDHLPVKRSIVGADDKQEVEARSNLDHLPEKRSIVGADDKQEAPKNLDHVAEKLSSGKADEVLEETNDTAHRQNRSPSGEEIRDRKDTLTLEDSDKSFSAPKTEDKEETNGTAHQQNRSPSKEEIRDGKDLGDSDKSFSASKTEDKEDVKEMVIDVKVSDPSVHKQGAVKKAIRKTGTFLSRILKEQAPDDHSAHSANAEAQGNTEKGEELNWQQILLNGLEDGEKILLKEYTTILRNYKDMKKRLSEAEKKERESQFDMTLQMRELKRAISKRDEEIVHLRQRLNSLEADKDVKEDTNQLSSSSMGDCCVQSEKRNEDLDVNRDAYNTPTTHENVKSRSIFINRNPSMSRVEEKLRTDIDAILDENLDFWLRFSGAFHQVQKFKTEVKDLQDEISKLGEKRKPDGSFTPQIKSEVLPIYKHLREIQRELTLWMEESESLKDELKSRLASLCSIQEDITRALKEGVEEEEIKFSSHQAAKLQGEILNMKQENDKVREELLAGRDHVSVLQLQIEKTLAKLNEEFGITNDQPENMNRHRVPLRSFIFGTKPKKQKNSIFSCMHPNRRYQVLKAGIRMSNRSSS